MCIRDSPSGAPGTSGEVDARAAQLRLRTNSIVSIRNSLREVLGVRAIEYLPGGFSAALRDFFRASGAS
eukprot:3081680-Alexandrium_andersonii.AAC.1